MANPYTEAAYQEASRYLDPYWQQQQRAFDQSLVGRGWSPGTEAYQSATADFRRDMEDAYRGAAFDAMQYGRGIQESDRAFGESARRFNEQFGESQRQFDVGLGETQRQFDEGTRRYEQDFGEAARRFDLGFGESQRQFDLPLAEAQYRDRRDFGEDVRRYDQGFSLTELQALENIRARYGDEAYRAAVFNASRQDQQVAQIMAMLGFQPTGGAQPINMASAFNTSMLGDEYARRADQQTQQGIVDAISGAGNIDWGQFFSGLGFGGS